MDWADAVNALFQIGGAVFCWKNVIRLHHDRAVRGVYWPSWILFAVWGWWNVFYFGPNLGQWLTWCAGLFLVLANTTWVILALVYRSRGWR